MVIWYKELGDETPSMFTYKGEVRPDEYGIMSNVPKGEHPSHYKGTWVDDVVTTVKLSNQEIKDLESPKIKDKNKESSVDAQQEWIDFYTNDVNREIMGLTFDLAGRQEALNEAQILDDAIVNPTDDPDYKPNKKIK